MHSVVSFVERTLILSILVEAIVMPNSNSLHSVLSRTYGSVQNGVVAEIVYLELYFDHPLQITSCQHRLFRSPLLAQVLPTQGFVSFLGFVLSGWFRIKVLERYLFKNQRVRWTVFRRRHNYSVIFFLFTSFVSYFHSIIRPKYLF